MQYSILLIDDNARSLAATRHLLEDDDYSVTAHSTAGDAIASLREFPRRFSIAIVDYHLPDMSGAEAVRELLKVNPDLFVLIYSGDTSSRDIIKESWETGAVGFMEKGEDPEVLLRKIRTWCHKFDETKRIAAPRMNGGDNEKAIRSIGLVGRSQELADIARMAKRYGQEEADANVLIRGESGTGKELIARAIHETSSRRKYRFVAVNSSAIQETIAESLFFGHEKGAFTGASDRKQGFFEAASFGTLFLDEIGDASLSLQAKLLRAIQEKVITPVGSTRDIKVNVRIVAATHKSLEALIAAGKFREDLYYRLNVISLVVPPLRHRPEDIEPLVMHFLQLHNEKRERPKEILHKSMKMLEGYNWPGNVRELQNYMERLVLNSPENRITPQDLGGDFFEKKAPSDLSLVELVRRQEVEQRDYVTLMLRKHSIREAAKRMGVSKSTLHNMMKRFGLVNPEPSTAIGGGHA